MQEQIAEHEKQLDSLRAVEKLLDIRINGKPERKKPGPRKATAAASPSAAPGGQMSGNLGNRILDLIISKGPVMQATAARLLGVEERSITMAVGHSARLTIEEGKIVNTGA